MFCVSVYTVGFIRDLPHGLVDAFQATLQEAGRRKILLPHVVDGSNRAYREQIEQVQRVLAGNRRRSSFLNYSFLTKWMRWMSHCVRPLRVIPTSWPGRAHRRVFVSAVTGSGLGVLRSVLGEIVAKESDQMSPAFTVELT